MTKMLMNLAVGALLGAALLGCGRTGSPRPVYPARTKVQFEGRALPGAFVVLHPVDGKADEPRPFGVANAEGIVELTTYKPGDGAPPGSYIATVEYRAKPRTEDQHPLLQPNLLSPRYSRPESSGLKMQVVEGPNELPAIQLAR